MVQQAVQDGGGQDRIVEDLAPVDEALVAGQNDGGALPGSSTKGSAHPYTFGWKADQIRNATLLEA